MRDKNSATRRVRPPILGGSAAGLWWGFVGVAAFSFTVPFTRVAVAGLSPLFVGSARAVVAAALAATALAVTRQRRPRGAQWWRLGIVAAGVVVGFPLLTSFALTRVPAGHGAVVIGLLPAATAVMAVIRVRERAPRAFWILTAVGAIAAITFAVVSSGGLGRLQWADLLLAGAVVAAAVGYAEGGLLARELGSWQTISWALLLCSPVMVVLTATAAADRWPTATPTQWTAFAYLGVVSMFLGFVAWYRGLGIGPIARVSQIQLVQPVLTISWAGLLLGELITGATAVGGLAVVLCAGLAVHARTSPDPLREVSPERVATSA